MNLKFMFQTPSSVDMPLGTWVEVQVHSYHALTHVCVGSCMCRAQATPLSSRRRDRINSVLLRSYYKGGRYNLGGRCLGVQEVCVGFCFISL